MSQNKGHNQGIEAQNGAKMEQRGRKQRSQNRENGTKLSGKWGKDTESKGHGAE